MSITKFNNKGNSFTYRAPEGTPYKKLKDLYDKKHPDNIWTILGAFVHDGQYGENAVLVTSDCYVNLPDHMVRRIKDLISDDEVIAQINAGAAGFKIYEYENKKGNKSYSVTFVDREPLPF